MRDLRTVKISHLMHKIMELHAKPVDLEDEASENSDEEDEKVNMLNAWQIVLNFRDYVGKRMQAGLRGREQDLFENIVGVLAGLEAQLLCFGTRTIMGSPLPVNYEGFRSTSTMEQLLSLIHI